MHKNIRKYKSIKIVHYKMHILPYSFTFTGRMKFTGNFFARGATISVNLFENYKNEKCILTI